MTPETKSSLNVDLGRLFYRRLRTRASYACNLMTWLGLVYGGLGGAILWLRLHEKTADRSIIIFTAALMTLGLASALTPILIARRNRAGLAIAWVLAACYLPFVPLGTGAGIYLMIYLASADMSQHMADASPETPGFAPVMPK